MKFRAALLLSSLLIAILPAGCSSGDEDDERAGEATPERFPPPDAKDFTAREQCLHAEITKLLGQGQTQLHEMASQTTKTCSQTIWTKMAANNRLSADEVIMEETDRTETQRHAYLLARRILRDKNRPPQPAPGQ
jgi:hypothetical protein